ncbi:hypothetical protein I3842_12G015800 [Carya illinoinensis]|uniref:Uncharacterized protein n=1 Tax=Carya illinoinensis TaxID=32201 RepID=A0A922IVT0_CARIL|nr:hypothetical protein I3842_12G015800 [Carya illinoinensis]
MPGWGAEHYCRGRGKHLVSSMLVRPYMNDELCLWMLCFYVGMSPLSGRFVGFDFKPCISWYGLTIMVG